MEIFGSIIASCLCATLKLALEQIVNLEVKLKQNDPSIATDIRDLLDNVKSYPKSDRKIIYRYVKKFMDLNASSASLDESSSNNKNVNNLNSASNPNKIMVYQCVKCEKLEQQLNQIELFLTKIKENSIVNSDSVNGGLKNNEHVEHKNDE